MEAAMKITDFREMYQTELQEARSVERQLIEAFPRLIEAASDPDLKDALEAHLGAMRLRADQVEDSLTRQGADPGAHKDHSMRTMIAEAEKWVDMLEGPALRDAGLIASIQRILHYEIADWGTLATWAKQLADPDMTIMHEIVDQKKAADDTLTRLAKREVNPEAAP